jgi:hypothetical protein
MVFEMEEVDSSGRMDRFIRAIGKTIWLMAWVVLFMLTVMYMRVNGLMINLKVKASIFIKTEPHTLVNGSTTNSMVMVYRDGLTELVMKGILLMG